MFYAKLITPFKSSETHVRFNIIGAGRLGKNLALSLMTRAGCQLTAVCNRHLHHAEKAVTELGTGIAVATLTDLPMVDITFITTPDDSIASIAAEWVSPSPVVVHCSGVLSSDVLVPLKAKGSLVASIHPLRAFRDNHLQRDALQGCDCVVEGNEDVVCLLTALFSAMGAEVVPIKASKKGSYHAAAVMASNYVVTLAGCAIELLLDAGLTEIQAKDMTQHLMQSSLTNIQNTNHVADALTGPLARGDVGTIETHLQAITAPHIAALYRAAGLATLLLTNLDPSKSDALTRWLNEH